MEKALIDRCVVPAQSKVPFLEAAAKHIASSEPYGFRRRISLLEVKDGESRYNFFDDGFENAQKARYKPLLNGLF